MLGLAGSDDPQERNFPESSFEGFRFPMMEIRRYSSVNVSYR